MSELRTVYIWPSNVEDVQMRDDHWALLVRGKGHDRLINLRSDVGEAVQRYLEHRDPVLPDARGEPLFADGGNRAQSQRSCQEVQSRTTFRSSIQRRHPTGHRGPVRPC